MRNEKLTNLQFSYIVLVYLLDPIGQNWSRNSVGAQIMNGLWTYACPT